MEQNIEYTGMTSQPSDYACGDGEMKLAVNAEYRDGGYHAVRVPKDVEFKKEGFEPLYVHNVNNGGESEIIVVGFSENHLCYKIDDTIYQIEECVNNDSILDITNIGNFLIFTNNKKIKYYLYKNGHYQKYSRLPPLPYFRFSSIRCHEKNKDEAGNGGIETAGRTNIIKISTGTSGGMYDDNLSTTQNVANFKKSSAYSSAKDVLLGPIESMRNTLAEFGRFMFPVLIRYGLRLYDGSIVRISPPILTFPLNIPPYYRANHSRIEFESYYIDFFISSYSGDVREQMNEIIELNEKWKDIVKSVDIFMSPYIYNVDLSDLEVTAAPYANEIKVDLKYIKGEEAVRNISNFYLVRSIDIRDLHNYATYGGGSEINKLISREYPLGNYTQNEALNVSESIYDNCDLIANGLFSYNNRLIAYGIKRDIYVDNYPSIYSCSVFTNKDAVSGYSDKGSATISNILPSNSIAKYFGGQISIEADEYYIEITNGKKYFVKKVPLKNKKNIFPLYISWPDMNAYRIYWKDKEDKSHFIQFERSDFSLFSSVYKPQIQNIDKIPEEKDEFGIDESLIKESEINNPIIFKDGNSVSCGNGSVITVGSNAMAVSQGQFGQYPIFSFCSDGVYSLSVGTDGVLQSCTPYSYDRITSKEGLLSMNRNILFLSQMGLMQIGENVRQLILPADKTATYAYDQGKSDHQKTFVGEFLNTQNYSSPEYTDLYTYLTSGAKMAYDYSHGRLIMYNPKYDYSYIMEEKSGMWSIMDKSFSRRLNVYEKCLLVDKDGQTVYDYSSDDVIEEQNSYLITRPFKLGAPDTHKSVQSIIQRGVFCNKEEVKQCLYASNDLYNWVPVKSSNSIYMRGMRGTGYKYFRQILFLPNFKQDEVLHGASITYEPRLTNKMR